MKTLLKFIGNHPVLTVVLLIVIGDAIVDIIRALNK